MIYTPKIQREVRAVKAPHDFAVDIVEYNFHTPYIGLRFYESHWRYLSENERLRCITYLNKIKSIIEGHGISVTLDPVYDIPGGQQLG